MDTSVIFGSLKLARSIAEFSGLIETIGTKIDRLAKAEFEAGFRALEQAAISSSEKDSLLREARYRFNKAISFEKEERLFLCHVGLAICHKELNDHSNFRVSLLSACKVQTKRHLGLSLVGNIILKGPVFGMVLPPPEQAYRQLKLETEQKKIKAYLANVDI